ncbi:MAG: IS110 family transposase [Solirubrobacterales bacterium]|nr:IS110 family transposase [Solirubrobacterales bacterium]
MSTNPGALHDDITIEANPAGYRQLLEWAEGFGSERRWAVEFGRHVAGGLERFLLAEGEHVVRVPPKLMAAERRAARGFGKSDAIDALAIARAALREPSLPQARVDGPERELALLVEYRDQLVADHTRITRRLRWLLHDLDPTLEPPLRSLSNLAKLERLGRRLQRLEPSTQVRLCRDSVTLLKDLVRRSDALKREILGLVRQVAPALLEIVGCGPLIAARIAGDIGAIDRFASDAHLASYCGISPLQASSGKHQRHRLSRQGNRKLNRALPHRAHPGTHPPRSPRLHRPPHQRRQDPPRSPPRP